MNLKKVRADVHSKILNLRSIEQQINTTRFHNLWEDSTDYQRQRVEQIIGIGDRGSLWIWIRRHPSLDLGEMHVTELRRIAKLRRIPNYSRLSKIQLLTEIREGNEKSRGH